MWGIEKLEVKFQFKDTDFIKLITGVRRSGKSVLLTQYQDYLQQQGVSKERIFYLNFESFEHQWVKTAEDFHQLVQETLPKTTEKIYFCFGFSVRLTATPKISVYF